MTSTAQQEFVSLKNAAERKIDGIGKMTGFRVDPRKIEVEPGFNRPISMEHVAQIEASIDAGAVIPPIDVRVEAGRIILVDGEHRWRAVMNLISKGRDIESMAANEFKGGEEERVAHLLTSSQGLGIAPHHAGEKYKLLITWGWSADKIAARVGKSKSHIEQCLLLANSNRDVRKALDQGEVSASVAATLVRQHGSKAGKVIAGHLEQAKATGGKRVTASAIKPKSRNAELLELVRQIPDSVKGEWADKVRVLLGAKG